MRAMIRLLFPALARDLEALRYVVWYHDEDPENEGIEGLADAVTTRSESLDRICKRLGF